FSLSFPGNRDPLIRELKEIVMNTVGFITDNDQPFLYCSHPRYILSLQHGYVHPDLILLLHPRREIGIKNFHPGNASRSRLHNLWVIQICTIMTAKNLLHTKPIRCADNGSKISRILDGI